MGDEELEWLHNTAAKVPVGGLIIEIGAWLGRSSAAIYSGIQDGVTVISIDTWKGQENLQDSDHILAKHIDLHVQYIANMQMLGLDVKEWNVHSNPGIYWLKCDGVEAANLFPDSCVDWWFDDGDHMNLGADIDAWQPKIKADALQTGHDYFCFYETIQKEIHKRFYINALVNSIWVRYTNGNPPEWYI